MKSYVHVHAVGASYIIISAHCKRAFSLVEEDLMISNVSNYLYSVISTDVLTAIHENLPEEFKGDMIRVFHKRLEFDFHPADYHVMLATTTGLRTAAGHLVKVHDSHILVCII